MRQLLLFASVLCLPLLGQLPGFPIPIEAPVETLEKTPIFGTTVVSTTGLVGQIYFVANDTGQLPNFKKLKPKGTIYTTRLNIPPRSFTEGFPGLTDRFEWFAIQYTARFWVAKAGNYEFALLSDDGSKLHIDGKEVIDNDGQHPPRVEWGTAKLSEGAHRIQVSYFQGPRTTIALVLAVAKPHQFWRIFDTNEFLPPPEKFDEWTAAGVADEAARKKKN